MKLTQENILDYFNKGGFAVYCETKEDFKNFTYIYKNVVLEQDDCCENVYVWRHREFTIVDSNYNPYTFGMKYIDYKEFEEIYFSKDKKEVTKNKKMNIEKYRNQIIHFLDNDLRFEVDFVTRFKIPMEKENSYSSAIVKWLTSYEEEKIKLNKFEYDLIDVYYKSALPNNVNQKLKQYNIICQLKEKGNFKNVDLEMTIGELKNRMEVEKC